MPGSEAPAAYEDIVAAFARAASKVGVRYAFVGGVAVGAWGQPRTTSDIDVIVDLDDSRSQALVDALDEQGLQVEVEDLEAGLREGGHVTLFSADPVLHVDLKPATSEAERREIQEAASVPLGRCDVYVVRPEHAVAYKVLFGSEQDLADARSIVARQGKRLDRDRLLSIAGDLGVPDEVRDLLTEVDELLGEGTV